MRLRDALIPSILAPAATTAVLPTRPPLRDGARFAALQSTDIRERLPNAEPKTNEQDDSSILIPEPPPLREGDAAAIVLIGVKITGATVFAAEDFAPLYDKLLARPISVSDIAKLVEAITDMYRREGYFLSRALAPAQDASDGILRIEIAEGHIAHVLIEGNAPQRVRRQLRSLKEETPLRLSALERKLALVGDLPGVKVRSSRIEPDPGDLTRHLLIVKVDVDRLEAAAYVDNRGTPEAGEIQAYGRVAANSVVRAGDRLSVDIFTVPDDPQELVLSEIAYQAPLNDAGTYITISGMASKFDAGALLAALDTESRTWQVSARLSHPIIRQRKTSLWANVAFESRDIMEERMGVMQFEDKLRVAKASVNFQSSYWNGSTSIYAELSRGLNVLSASNGGSPLSRPDADGEFTKIEGRLSRYQNIGKSFGLFASVAGQASSEPLLASEEFAIGGAQFGRAYNYAEISGDDAIAALIELRFGRRSQFKFLDFYQFYGFYDVGTAWNDNAAPQFGELTIRSAGGGVRLNLPASLYINLEAARPLNRIPATQNDRDWRAFFAVSKSF